MDQVGSEAEVSDLLPCVQHKTGALHSIVCWGENRNLPSNCRTSVVNVLQNVLNIRVYSHTNRSCLFFLNRNVSGGGGRIRKIIKSNIT